ncbi:hypothetical protein VTN77DRAFT_2230 [Rasamsonia byssochlamydoides]|uniref:uncharacterized protein n=1 Tax=Rasamsonia byssochlamydoides TaxID=89139 RepID=UPI0037428D48
MTLCFPLHHTPQTSLSSSNASFSSLHLHSGPERLKHQLGLILNVGSLAWHGYHHRPSPRRISLPQSSITRETPLPTTQLLRSSTVEDNASFPLSLHTATQLASQVAKANGMAATNSGATRGDSVTSTSRSHQPYGTFLPKSTPSPVSRRSIVPFRRPNLTETLVRNLSQMDIMSICHQFSPEIIGLAIFLLVPTAVLVVEGMDMLYEWWTPEQFPERGRGRVRLTGAERQLSALAAWEREKIVARHSRSRWWRLRRRSR